MRARIGLNQDKHLPVGVKCSAAKSLLFVRMGLQPSRAIAQLDLRLMSSGNTGNFALCCGRLVGNGGDGLRNVDCSFLRGRPFDA